MNVLIGVYTNEVKDYCDQAFLDNVHALAEGNSVLVVDNSPNIEYTQRLKELCKEYSNFTVSRIEVYYQPKNTLFHRNVTESVNYIREQFLQGRFDSLLIIESDVFPPHNLLKQLEHSIKQLPSTWGILGGIYYKGFHDYTLKGLQQTHHVLSGCTLYKRSLIENYPFRYNPLDLAPFPDALISYDAGKLYTLWNDHHIICEHRENINGIRYSKPL